MPKCDIKLEYNFRNLRIQKEVKYQIINSAHIVLCRLSISRNPIITNNVSINIRRKWQASEFIFHSYLNLKAAFQNISSDYFGKTELYRECENYFCKN